VLQFHKNLVWIQSSTKVALRKSGREEDEELPHSQNPNNILQILSKLAKPHAACLCFFPTVQSLLYGRASITCLPVVAFSDDVSRIEPPHEKPNEIPQTLRQARKTLLACVCAFLQFQNSLYSRASIACLPIVGFSDDG
jgi:hypothetical protein